MLSKVSRKDVLQHMPLGLVFQKHLSFQHSVYGLGLRKRLFGNQN